jgi:adenine phosphoribosyltransferase
VLSVEELHHLISEVPDYPKPGISFKDATPIYSDPQALKASIYHLKRTLQEKCKAPVDQVLGAEARGFILGVPLALELDAGFIPVRKPGKLPRKTNFVEYDLEYGSDILHIHFDSLQAGDKVVIFDDLLATGGTALAKADLARQAGAEVVGFSFLIELSDLAPLEKLSEIAPVCSVLKFA